MSLGILGISIFLKIKNIHTIQISLYTLYYILLYILVVI